MLFRSNGKKKLFFSTDTSLSGEEVLLYYRMSTLQRSASHCASRVDILEAYQVGGAAVKAADEGDSGKMVVLQRLSDDPYQCGTEVKDVHKIANDEKVVPREWVTEDGSYVTDDFVSYVRPLIQGDVSPVMVDGIPRHLYRKN